MLLGIKSTSTTIFQTDDRVMRDDKGKKKSTCDMWSEYEYSQQ